MLTTYQAMPSVYAEVQGLEVDFSDAMERLPTNDYTVSFESDMRKRARAYGVYNPDFRISANRRKPLESFETTSSPACRSTGLPDRGEAAVSTTTGTVGRRERSATNTRTLSVQLRTSSAMARSNSARSTSRPKATGSPT